MLHQHHALRIDTEIKMWAFCVAQAAGGKEFAPHCGGYIQGVCARTTARHGARRAAGGADRIVEGRAHTAVMCVRDLPAFIRYIFARQPFPLMMDAQLFTSALYCLVLCHVLKGYSLGCSCTIEVFSCVEVCWLTFGLICLQQGQTMMMWP